MKIYGDEELSKTQIDAGLAAFALLGTLSPRQLRECHGRLRCRLETQQHYGHIAVRSRPCEEAAWLCRTRQRRHRGGHCAGLQDRRHICRIRSEALTVRIRDTLGDGR